MKHGRNNKGKGMLMKKKEERVLRCKRLLVPTYPNMMGSCSLIDSDFDNKSLIASLKGYTTVGSKTMLWRASADGPSYTQVGGASPTDVAGSINCRLANFPGYADFTTCFDLYRLKAFAVDFYPANGVMQVSGSALAPRLYTVIDYDDSNTISRLACLQYDTCVVAPPGTGVARALVPRFARAVYGGGAFTSYESGNPKTAWFDIASPNVEFYGVKFLIEAGAVGQTIVQNYVTTLTAFWEFKSTR